MAHSHRGICWGLHTLARINLRLACDCLWYYCHLQKHSVCGKTASVFPLLNWRAASGACCGTLHSSARLASWASPCCQLQPKSHPARLSTDSPALLPTIKGQRQDRYRNENRQASVRANKVSNVGRNLGAWRSRNLEGKMPIMAYFPAVKNIKTHFKNVVLTTAISGP